MENSYYKLIDYVVGEEIMSKSRDRIFTYLNNRIIDYGQQKIKVYWTIENNILRIIKYENQE